MVGKTDNGNTSHFFATHRRSRFSLGSPRLREMGYAGGGMIALYGELTPNMQKILPLAPLPRPRA